MRVIITGGTGIIGRALAEDLAADGCEVFVLSRMPEKSANTFGKGIEVREWDGKTSKGWGELANGAEAIVNLAGENLSSGRWTEKRKQRFRESRDNAGQAVVQAVEQADVMPRTVVQSSAVGYYGPRNNEKLVTEKTSPGKDFLALLCKDWEAATAPVEQYGIRRIVIRTGVVITPKGGALPKMALPYKLFVGGPVGSGRQWFPWIHPADEVAAIRFLIDNPKAKGPFNLSAPNPVTNRRFGKILASVLGRPNFFPVPVFLLKLLFGEMSTVVLDGQRAVPKRLLDLGFKFRFPELESALRDLYGK